MAKVSVIIPVFNVEKYIRRCVESVTNQTLHDIEIICVDDASTDGSRHEIETLARADSRIRLIALDENMSASQARKAGVLSSTGEVVMFLDGDDVLFREACQVVYDRMQKDSVEIVHFGTEIINCGGAEEARIRWNQEKLSPYQHLVEGDLISACFEQEKFSFTLWNKAFRGKLAREAFAYVEDGSFPRAQDLYATFILLYFAKSYVGIPNTLIKYHFGTGITGRSLYELAAFERIAKSAKVANAIFRFLKRVGGESRYGKVHLGIRRNLLNDCLNQWMKHISLENVAHAFDLLIDQWPQKEVISAIARRSLTEARTFNMKRIAEALGKSRRIKDVRPKNISVIGVFYYRYHGGGVQRVLSLLIPIFQRLGYKVVLITEEHVPDLEYALPSGVEREIIPPFLMKPQPNYKSRADALERVVRKHKIDVFNTHASSGVELLFDILLVQALGCYSVISRHELAFMSMLETSDRLIRHPPVFRLADRLTCLTRMDEQYYRIMGAQVRFVPNPSPDIPIQEVRVASADPIVLWVGRLDYPIKQCQEPLEIMHQVVKSVPNARLLMVGGDWTVNATSRLKKRINELNLNDNVELCGYTSQPESYYRLAACQLITSAVESYSMVIEEGRAFGLPLVLYDLPYLELLQEAKGYISVTQGDRQGAAQAIISLLSDPDKRGEIGREAQGQFVQSRHSSICQDSWQEILSFNKEMLFDGGNSDPKLLRQLMDTILDLYVRGVAGKRNELASARAEVKRLSALLDSQSSLREKIVAVPKSSQDKLRELESRRKRFGSLGALDFLIDHYVALSEPTKHEEISGRF